MFILLYLFNKFMAERLETTWFEYLVRIIFMKMKIMRTVTVFDDVCFLAEYNQDIIGIFIRSEYLVEQ